jgi:hypothetical protein
MIPAKEFEGELWIKAADFHRQKKEWVGLTDEEIMDACSAVWASHPVEVGKIVQNLLKEKNI